MSETDGIDEAFEGISRVGLPLPAVEESRAAAVPQNHTSHRHQETPAKSMSR
ncbi:hypothetical protein [Paenarthrobacter sp. NCHU4564]|uniref:hypothetical protein n=1 Tax=Paenarthrobacter sp. NCHU4564 TaxID=3451353 RepID=UPI003F971A6B